LKVDILSIYSKYGCDFDDQKEQIRHELPFQPTFGISFGEWAA
jgi:hypothetical protein